MRLLQLAVSPDEIIDLHPLVSVVSGLDPDARRRLADAVAGLATGSTGGANGLLEAHGVLFDLLPEMLDLLDITADDLRPVIVADDLPVASHDPARRERAEARRHLAGVDERLATAREAELDARAALTAATDALERAQRAQADLASRAQEIDSFASELDRSRAERQRLEEELAVLLPEARRAAARRDEVEAATADIRRRRDEAVEHLVELARRLEQARHAYDPSVEAAAERARVALADVEAEVEAERELEGAAEGAPAPQEPAEPPAERLAAVEEQITLLEQRLAAFGPAETHPVAEALERVRPSDGFRRETLPEAAALADELAALDVDLNLTESPHGSASEVAQARDRLEAARQALAESELAVRNPELDRDMVNQLEQAHADLLEAMDKADSRFGGARAKRRVEELREAERSLLDDMGFTSYSDYMMGNSLLHVDSEKEEALEAARRELASAEDLWGSLAAETDAELARAEVIEHRRRLLEQARALLRRPVPPAAAVEELRALKVEVASPAISTDGLRQALEDAGLALGDDELEQDDLVLVAEAWLAEASTSPAREHELRDELRALEQQRDELRVVVEHRPQVVSGLVGPSRAALLSARLSEARELVRATEERRAAHRLAAEVVATGDTELVAAEEAERVAREAAIGADEALAQAVADDEVAQAGLRGAEEALAAAIRAESEADERLRAKSGREDAPAPEQDAATALVAAETVLASTDAAAAEAAQTVAALDEERRQAAMAVEALAPAEDDGSVAEEIEWYVLARLAAQRSVSLGGSLPLLVDDALAGLGEEELSHLLGRLERMAQAVQIIVVTDDPSATAWALRAGNDRAAVVQPQPA